MNWKPRDRAIIVDDGNIHNPENRLAIGEECSLIRPTGRGDFWDVDIGGEVWEVRERCLRPIYDGNEKVSWEDCVFKPDEVRV